MTAATTTDQLKCTKCPRIFRVFDGLGKTSLESAARTSGWRIYEGESVTGSPLSIVACPICAGTATKEQREELEGWAAQCDTCGVAMWDEEWDRGDPITQKQAEDWADDHECETNVQVIKPKSLIG